MEHPFTTEDIKAARKAVGEFMDTQNDEAYEGDALIEITISAAWRSLLIRTKGKVPQGGA